jgi:hypothetical protein
MKWIKHYTNASDGEFLSWLVDEYGLEGYARWWIILEKVGARMDKSDCCSASYSLEKWSSFLKQKQNKMVLFLKQIENKSKIFLELNGNILTIKIPKMLEYKDNYSKDLEATSKSTTKQDIDTDIDKEKKEIKRKKVRLPHGNFDLFWSAYPVKRSKGQAEKAWNKINPDGQLLQVILTAIAAQKAWRTNPPPGKLMPEWKYPATWLNAKAWLDETDYQPPANGDKAYCSKHNQFFPLDSKCPQCK